MTAIERIGKVLMVIYPIKDPIPLKRAGCIFEVYAISCHPGCGLEQKVRSNKSYGQGDDWKVIEASVGYGKLDRMVVDVFAKWLGQEVRRRIVDYKGDDYLKSIEMSISLAGLYRLQGEYDLAKPLFTSSLEKRTEILGLDHPKTLESMHDLATLYK
ncbi:hypothetical protein BJ742DRAFT_905365 [Cladochytrium replicatum]|nr:hypothetical protein BJ742DRAFT_905365 [Cladochytrium replicatum]